MDGVYRITSDSRLISLSIPAICGTIFSAPSKRVGSCSRRTTVWLTSLSIVKSWWAVNALRTSKFLDDRLIEERRRE